jgi:hypothetical protein
MFLKFCLSFFIYKPKVKSSIQGAMKLMHVEAAASGKKKAASNSIEAIRGW